MKNQTAPLREQYPTAYNSWRNMKRRVKENGGIVHPAFEDFSSFLDAMSPPPSDKHTLDRIDNNLKEYSPENCRWASKREQSGNRRNTIFLEADGVRQSLTDWAEDTNQKPNTLRGRYRKGWSEKEVIYGRRRNISSYNKVSTSSLSPHEVHKFKNLKPYNCHATLIWPWLSESDAKHFEVDYLERNQYPETRYDFFDRVSAQQLKELGKVISDLSWYRVWMMAPENYDLDQMEGIYWICDRYGLTSDNFKQVACRNLSLRTRIKNYRSDMLRYKEIEGPFHHKGFQPR